MLRTLILLIVLVVFNAYAQRTCVPSCISPQLCDTNTGICRTFRQAFNGPVTLNCPSGCPSGTSCDTNTGICRQFRVGGK